MNSKGIMFSIMAFFLGLLVLALSFIANQNLQESEAGYGFTSSSQKTFSIFENVEENILEILENVAGISVNISDSSVAFTETLPQKKRKANFDVSVENYKRFALSQIKEADLNINDEVIDLSILQIEPFDINYMHSNVPGKGWRDNTDAFIAPKEINFRGYFVIVTLLNQTYQSITTDFKACTGTCSKGIKLDLNVVNANKIIEATTSHPNLDPYKTSTVTIKTSGNAQNDIIVTAGPNGQLRVENKNSVPIELQSGVIFDENAGTPSLRLPENMVSVGDRITGFKKNN